MPNWVKNKLTIEGENAEDILKSLCSYGAEDTKLENPYFDFNKIIPMPKELNIVSGSMTYECIEFYLAGINPDVDYFGEEKASREDFSEQLKIAQKYNSNITGCQSIEELNKTNKCCQDYKELNGKSLAQYGKQAIDNVKNHGHMDWYDWSISNWGTKWNAAQSEIEGNVVEFYTAWSLVDELIQTLSEKYPDNEFHYEWAEEQIGLYSGNSVFKDGHEISGGYFEEYSKDAYETHFKLWGQDERFVFDEDLDNYVFIEEKCSGAEM